MAERDIRSRAEQYLSAVERYRDARIRFSQEFLLNKARSDKVTDRMAEHMAITGTNDELTTLSAELEVARREYAQESTTQSNSNREGSS